MVFHWYSYHILTIILILFSAAMLGYVFVQRHKNGAWCFMWILCLVILWLAAQGLEFSVQELQYKLIFANIQYIPITVIPALYFFLSLQFSRKYILLRKKSLAFLFLIVPLALNVLLWTDPYHGLIRHNLHLVTSGIVPTVGKSFGPIMLPFAIYNFSLTAVTLIILGSAWIDKRFHYREQAKYLLIGLLIPSSMSLLHYIGVDFHNIDMTPLSFALTGILLTWGIFRHGLFDLVPIALNHIFNEMEPGLIVYDNSLRLIDINPSAKKILDLDGRRIIGLPVSAAFAHAPELVNVAEKRRSCREEVPYCGMGGQSYYEITTTHLENSRGVSLGWMAQIYDITERKGAENRLRLDKETAEQTSISNESAFLHAQIKPHFLFNTLNIISVLCRMDPEKARELILDLSSYMRHSFDFKNLEKYVSFEEELEFIQAYVRIEQARFKGGLDVIYDIDNTEGLKLPPLLLQPLVENAVRHGVRKSVTGSTVILRVRNLDDHYLIEVEDDGAGMPPEKLEEIFQMQGTDGVGLANIQKRLGILYGTKLSIESQLGLGTKITMTLPKRKENAE